MRISLTTILAVQVTFAAGFVPHQHHGRRKQQLTLAMSTTTNNENINGASNSRQSWSDGIRTGGIASAAAMATAAVNAAVAMKSLEAPDVSKSYIALNATSKEIDEQGLPLVYDKDLIEAYWSRERGALQKRWAFFVGKAVPFLTKMVTLFIRDGKIVDSEIPALSRQARLDIQDLGATFIKLGQGTFALFGSKK
jgi:hypothetical protein